MALPGVIIHTEDESGNLVPRAAVTYTQYVVAVIKGVKKGLDIALNEIIAKNEAQDESINAAAAKAQQGITDASRAQSSANEAKAQATTNRTAITNLTNRFGTVTKFNSGTATPTYSCADGEVYFQIKS